jgi:ankyrin repeat protein
MNAVAGLLHAVYEGDQVAVVRQLKAGAEVNGSKPDGFTPLMRAVTMEDAAMVELLLARGADPNKQDRKGWSALMFAAAGGARASAETLLRHGARVDQRNDRGETALDLALKRVRGAEFRGAGAHARREHARVIRILTARGGKRP